MKNVLLMLVGISMLLMFGCKKGDQGPQGPPGPAGTDSTFEGFASGIKCATCHNPDQDTAFHVMAREHQWAQSRHASGVTSERNNVPCSGCHTTEGFMERAGGHAATPQLNPSPINCFACHSPHSRANFTLRIQTAAAITSNTVGVADTLFNYGTGNLCAQCHQPRSTSPKIDPGADSIVIKSPFWEPHFGTQSAMLMGAGGFKFSGYPYGGNSYHSTASTIKAEGCVVCHMAESFTQTGTGRVGGHTMKISDTSPDGTETLMLAGCLTSGCHASITDPNFAGPTTAPLGAQDVIQANLDTLKGLLAQRGWIDTTSSFPVNLTNGSLVIKPARLAGALYNYHLVDDDGSLGVHNTKYALDLLRSSIQALRTTP